MSGATDWRTPPEFFAALDDEFHFTMDLAASHENALISNYCTEEGSWVTLHAGTPEAEAIQISTRDGLHAITDMERVWCNPPYSPAATLAAFVEKCADHAKAGGLAVMLLNVSTDTRWFHKHIWDCLLNRPRERVEVRFLKGRIAFHGVLGTPIPSPRYSNMVVVFHPWEAQS